MDSIRRQFEKEATQTIADFEAYSKKARDEYEKYEAQARADYSRYTRSIKQTWGGDSIVAESIVLPSSSATSTRIFPLSKLTIERFW